MVKECYKCKKLDFLNPNVSFHKPPKELERRDKWMKLLGLNKSIPKLADICSDHFEEKDFILNKRGNRSLKRDALPKEEINKDPCIQDNSLQTSVSEPLMKSEVMKTELYAQPDQGFKDFKTVMTKSELKKEEQNDRKEDIKRIQENRLEFPIFINQNNIVKTEPADQDLKIDANDFVDYAIKNEEVLLKEEPDTNDSSAQPSYLQEKDDIGKYQEVTDLKKIQITKEMFICTNCNYQSSQKSRLRDHACIYKKPSKVYKCTDCVFQTIHQSSLIAHKHKHKDPDEVKAHSCDQCDFKTILRSVLYRHIRRHNESEVDKSKGKIFKCDHCDYQAVNRSNLLSHLIKHKDPSKIKTYNCDQCDFKTIRRSVLYSHIRRHNESEVDNSKRKIYNCAHCDYQTVNRSNFLSHLINHKHPSEIKTYNCDQCDFKTIRKSGLNTHIRSHNKLEVDKSKVWRPRRRSLHEAVRIWKKRVRIYSISIVKQ